jgi:hypothetical protein
MRITTVTMDFLTTGLQSQLSSVLIQAPYHQIQNVLSQLPARPLVPVHDRQIQSDSTNGTTTDPVTFDPFVTITGPGQDSFSLTQDLFRVIGPRGDEVLERSLGARHQQTWDGGSGSGWAARSWAVAARSLLIFVSVIW